MQESISNLNEGDIQELCLGSRPIPNSFFVLLHSLTVDGCHILPDVLLPLNLLRFLTNLETMEVRNCDYVKAIFDVKCTTKGTSFTFPLKKLTLSNFSNLENVWNEDAHEILSMHLLQEVHVEKCKHLKSLFRASVAKDVVELENLLVENCEGLINIVAEDNADPSVELTFPCPCVRSLKLRGLPNFNYFYYSLKSDIYTHLESHTKNQIGTKKVRTTVLPLPLSLFNMNSTKYVKIKI